MPSSNARPAIVTSLPALTAVLPRGPAPGTGLPPACCGQPRAAAATRSRTAPGAPPGSWYRSVAERCRSAAATRHSRPGSRPAGEPPGHGPSPPGILDRLARPGRPLRPGHDLPPARGQDRDSHPAFREQAIGGVPQQPARLGLAAVDGPAAARRPPRALKARPAIVTPLPGSRPGSQPAPARGAGRPPARRGRTARSRSSSRSPIALSSPSVRTPPARSAVTVCRRSGRSSTGVSSGRRAAQPRSVTARRPPGCPRGRPRRQSPGTSALLIPVPLRHPPREDRAPLAAEPGQQDGDGREPQRAGTTRGPPRRAGGRRRSSRSRPAGTRGLPVPEPASPSAPRHARHQRRPTSARSSS